MPLTYGEKKKNRERSLENRRKKQDLMTDLVKFGKKYEEFLEQITENLEQDIERSRRVLNKAKD